MLCVIYTSYSRYGSIKKVRTAMSLSRHHDPVTQRLSSDHLSSKKKEVLVYSTMDSIISVDYLELKAHDFWKETLLLSFSSVFFFCRF